MVTLDEALAIIERTVKCLPEEWAALDEAAGRVTSRAVHARLPAPRFDTSAMDGYAVTGTVDIGASFRIIGISYPGAGSDCNCGPGQAVRIFTGAQIPRGSDRVIIQENVARQGEEIVITADCGTARHIRCSGSDFAADALLLEAGTRLGPRALMVAAAADSATVAVVRRPRVTIIATGDELAPPGQAWRTQQAIPESVSLGVAAMAAETGAHLVGRMSGRDDIPMLTAMAAQALEASDLVVITGGASVGDRDFAKAMFTDFPLDLLFDKIAMKPGKPAWLGMARGKFVVGLPGNPMAAMVIARLILRPIIAALLGQSLPAILGWRQMTLACPIPATGARETFVRARRAAHGLEPVTSQDSGAQGVMITADWLIRCPAGQGMLAAGSPVMAIDF